MSSFKRDNMTFAESRITRASFGKHKGKTIDEIAADNEGLLYLDWLIGQEVYGRFGEALKVYLQEPAIAKEVESAIADKESRLSDQESEE